MVTRLISDLIVGATSPSCDVGLAVQHAKQAARTQSGTCARFATDVSGRTRCRSTEGNRGERREQKDDRGKRGNRSPFPILPFDVCHGLLSPEGPVFSARVEKSLIVAKSRLWSSSAVGKPII